MDGAAKFVRGDAIAALIITVINILGWPRSIQQEALLFQ
jgi:flagellar biosynthesis component FlhA